MNGRCPLNRHRAALNRRSSRLKRIFFEVPIYLACITEKAVTPSDEIDKVWHLHLTDTKRYWNNFCNKTLERELHHNPTEGGTHELKKFEEGYARTKALYEEEFDSPPPRDIWPPTDERFSRPSHMKRIDTSENFIIKKPLFFSFYKQLLILLFTSTSTTVLCVEITSNSSIDKAFVVTAFFMIFTGIFMLLIYHAATSDNPRRKNDGTGCGGGGCGGGCGGFGC